MLEAVTLMDWAATQPAAKRATQTQLVYATMKDGGWWTFSALRDFLYDHYARGISETGLSARIRELRQPPYNCTVELRPSPRKGIWEYRATQ